MSDLKAFESQVEESVRDAVPETYYDAARKNYLIPSKRGGWLPLSEPQFKRVLRSVGVSVTPPKHAMMSLGDEVILEVQTEKDVDFVGPVAGCDAGLIEYSGKRILVTDSPRVLDPEPGEWPTIKAVLAGMLKGEQLVFLLCWLKVAYEALRLRTTKPGQALVLAGPRDSGKSLLQAIITLLLGGRSARPYQFMAGGTAFNADLFGAEHLVLDDESPSTDIRARRKIGTAIKEFTVAQDHRCHAKGRTPIMLKPFWRVSISLNDEPEDLLVLPPIDDSIEDKLILLRVSRSDMPMRTASPEQRQAFWDALASEAPAFLHYLTEMEIPGNLRSERFGVRHFHHPDLLDEIDTLSPEVRLLGLIDSAVFDRERREWMGTASELERQLRADDNPFRFEANKVLPFYNACGVYLGRLARKTPDRVKKAGREQSTRVWTIAAPPAA